MHRRDALQLLLGSTCLAACSPNQNLVLRGGQFGKKNLVDAKPLALLPRGALLLAKLDAAALFRTSIGGRVAQIVNGLLPLGPESGFDPARDVTDVAGAVYAMQGADYAAIVQGRFNVKAMEQAARTRAATPSGAPVVFTQYGGYAMYTVSNMGFVVLTPNTILSGNETGMRRALDRLRFSRSLAGGLPKWMTEVFDNDQGDFAFAGDVRDQGAVAAVRAQLPFVDGLQVVRGYGNFAAPGMNMVGSLTYSDVQSAAIGAQSLGGVQRLASLLALVSAFGMGGGAPPAVRTQVQGANVAFASEVDAQLANTLLGMFGKLLTPGSTGVF